MKALLATTCLVAGALVVTGCATKKYVRNTTAPIQAKVDQVGEQTTQNTQQIQNTNNQVKQNNEQAQSGISAAKESASTADQHAQTADQHAQTALSTANQAAQTSNQNTQAIDSLRSVVANIDDYKPQTSATVLFRFNRYTLDDAARQNLDQLASQVKADKRFFITVEGFTDNIGAREYNDQLSRRRADAVVRYLVANDDIPVYRIHMIGLGEAKPVAEGHNRAARAKNRRVEVQVFSADQVAASLNGSGTPQASR